MNIGISTNIKVKWWNFNDLKKKFFEADLLEDT